MADIPTQSQEPLRGVFVVFRLGFGSGVVGEDIKSMGLAPASKASIEVMPRIKIHGSCLVCRFMMFVEEEEEAESRGGGQGREIGLGFVQSVLAVASLVLTLTAMAGSGRGSEQSSAGQADDGD
ncbi:hypothetical protein PTKIN_Ptkin08bG0056600 [Pterospermum kingtungense]